MSDNDTNVINKYARFKQYPGWIFFVDAHATKVVEVDPDLDCQDGWDWMPEFEEVIDMDRVVAHMVGDDEKFEFDAEEAHYLDEDEPVCSCGQDGCGWAGA